jgi:hypothetical protein
MKKKKKEPLPKIKRKLLKLWSEKVRSSTGNRCAICGLQGGECHNGVKQKIDAHHIEEKTTCGYLRYDPLNGIPLCVRHHKWGKDAVHNSPVFFINWLIENRPLQYNYVCNNRNKTIDLNKREILEEKLEYLQLPLTQEELQILNINHFFKNLNNIERKIDYSFYNLWEQE